MFSSEISEFRYQLTRLARQLRRISQNDPQSWSRMLVVIAIDRMGNNVTPSELAMAEDIYSSNLAVILRQLEEEGMVERKTDATDRRKTRVRLTEKGCSVLAESRKRRDDWLAQAFDEALSPEEATHLLKMTPLLNKLADHT